MNISAPFIQRPVGTSLLTIAVALVGLVAFRFLPVAALPTVDFPTISVSANLPGASPETMATSVAAPLERQFGRIAGVTEMTSTSYLGSASIVLQFDLNRNIDGAARGALGATNVNRPKGKMTDATRTWEIRTNDQLRRAEEYMPVIVAFRNGSAVRVMDVARVEDSVEDLRSSGFANGKPSVLVIIF